MTTASGSILTEEGDFIIQEDYILGDMSSSGDASAQNELFDTAVNKWLINHNLIDIKNELYYTSDN